MSPGAALRLPFLAIAHRVCTEVDPASRRVDSVDLDLDRVAQPQLASRALRRERGAHLVQIPPPAQPPDRQEALEALLAELDERALLDQPNDLPPEARRLVPARLGQRALEQEREADVVGVPLDLHRLA